MKSLTIHGVEVREWDEVVLTGVCCSWTGGSRWLENVAGTIGTVDVKEPSLKVWPFAELDDGKLWFMVADIDRIEVTHRGDSW